MSRNLGTISLSRHVEQGSLGEPRWGRDCLRKSGVKSHGQEDDGGKEGNKEDNGGGGGSDRQTERVGSNRQGFILSGKLVVKSISSKFKFGLDLVK